MFEDCKEEDEDEEEEEEDTWLTCSEEEEGRDAVSACWGTGTASTESPGAPQDRPVQNRSHLVQRDELLEVLKSVHMGKKIKAGEVTIGLVSWRACAQPESFPWELRLPNIQPRLFTPKSRWGLD